MATYWVSHDAWAPDLMWQGNTPKIQKVSHYRPGEALRVPGGWGSQISRQSAHEGGKVSSMHQPPLPPRKYSWYSFLLQTESTPSPEWLLKWKIPMIPSGIEPVTFWLVVQCFKSVAVNYFSCYYKLDKYGIIVSTHSLRFTIWHSEFGPYGLLFINLPNLTYSFVTSSLCKHSWIISSTLYRTSAVILS